LLILYSCKGSEEIIEKKSTLIEVDLAIENVRIFNSKTKEVFENKTILIQGDSILSIIENDFKTYHANNIINGKGKLITPGFIDTQTTTVLDLGQPEKWLDVSMQWQNNRSHKYPNIYNAGGALISDFNREPNMNHAEILGRNHAKEKINEYSNKGIRHIKLYSYLNEEDLKYVLDEANAYDISVFGHLDRGEVNVSRAMELEIKNFEHFFTLINSVITLPDHWIEFNNKYNLGRIRTVDEWSAAMILYFDYIDSNPELKRQLNDLIETMVTNGVNISTTISVFASVAEQSDFFSSFTTYPLRSSPHFPSYSNIDKGTLKSGFNTMMKYLKNANEKGLKIRIGTDCKYGGQALLNELMLLAKADIPVGDILQMATWNGAQAMNIEDKFGVIEEGKVADLIIFEENPFDNYNNFITDKTIIKNGKIFKPLKSIAKDMFEIIINGGTKEAIEWYKNIANQQEYYPHQETQINELAEELFKINKAKDAVIIIKFCLDEFSNSRTKYNSFSEQQLNEMGYHFLGLDNSGAIEIFKLNVELYPESWNVYDSLGEAYYLIGNLQLAKENYKKSLIINANNNNAIEVLKQIEK